MTIDLSDHDVSDNDVSDHDLRANDVPAGSDNDSTNSDSTNSDSTNSENEARPQPGDDRAERRPATRATRPALPTGMTSRDALHQLESRIVALTADNRTLQRDNADLAERLAEQHQLAIAERERHDTEVAAVHDDIAELLEGARALRDAHHLEMARALQVIERLRSQLDAAVTMIDRIDRIEAADPPA